MRPISLLLLLLAACSGKEPGLPAALPPRETPTQFVSASASAAVAAPAKEAPPKAGYDRAGDPLPLNAVARFGTLRLRHEAPIRSLALSADGSSIVTAGGSLHVWNEGDGRELHYERGAGWQGFRAAVFGPEGLVWAALDQDILQMRNENGTGVISLAAKEKGSITTLSISPDKKTLAVAFAAWGISLRDARTGELQRTIKLQSRGEVPWGGVESLAWSPDSKRLFSADTSDWLRAWDVATGAERRKLARKVNAKALAVSPRGDLLAYVDLFKVEMIDLESNTVRWTADLGAGLGESLAFAPDGDTLAVALRDEQHSLGLLDVATGTKTQALGPADVSLKSLQFSKDGKRIYAGARQSVWAWDREREQPVLQLAGADSAALALALSADGQRLATTAERAIHVWDLHSHARTHLFEVASSGPIAPKDDRMRPMFDLKALTFLPATGARELRTLSGDGYLRHLDLERGVLEATPVHPCSVAAFSADGATWASSGGSWSQGYKLKVGNNARVTELALEDVATSLSVSRAGGRIAVSDRDGARIVGPEGGLLVKLSDSRAEVITASPDDQFVAAAWSNYIDVYAKDGQKLRTLTVYSGSVKALAFSPDGQWIAAGTNAGTIELLRVADGSRAGRAEGHRGDCLALRFSDDGTTLFSSSSDTTSLAWSVTGLVAAGSED